jgi:peptidyl-tRNA hydrolase, PTH1 family
VQFRLIVGLGNPGREYRDTRHNVGFMIVDRMAASARTVFRTEKSWRAEVAKTGDVLLCKPLTYMNLSGESVRGICDFYKIGAEETLVILDDMNLPLGALRLRTEGSAGGHKGLQSVIAHLATKAVARLRVGIGSARAGEVTDHVLGRFSPMEKAPLEESLDRAVAAIACAQSLGFSAAMNAYN